MLQTTRSYRGMVSASQHLAARAGLRVLEEGGNAIEGIVTLNCAGHIDARLRYRSCGGSHLPPLLRRFVAKLAECLSGDQMALRVKAVVNGGMGGQKSLC